MVECLVRIYDLYTKEKNMKKSKFNLFKRLSSAVMAFLMILGSVYTAGIVFELDTPVSAVGSAEDDVLASSPGMINSMLVSTGAAVTVSKRVNGSTADENSYESPEEGYGKNYLVDGKVSGGNCWSTHPDEKEESATKEVTITLDLLGTFDINVVSLFSNNKGAGKTFFPNGYKVQYSTDGKNFKDINSKGDVDVNTTGHIAFGFDPISARYVRVVILKRGGKDANGYLAQLGEIAVFAKDVTPESYATSTMTALVSKDATVVASEDYFNTASHLTNGTTDNGTYSDRWYAAIDKTATTPVVVDLVLKERSYIHNIALFQMINGEYFPAGYQLFVSDGGATYNKVADVSGIASTRYTGLAHSFDPTWATHVRLVVTQRQYYAPEGLTTAVLSEIAVYGVTESNWGQV